jgi:hypothetical protein
MVHGFKIFAIASTLCRALASVANFLGQSSDLRCYRDSLKSEISGGNVKMTTYFDSAVQLAQSLIEASVPHRGNSTKHLDLSKWTKQTDGGLLPRDRIYLSKIYGDAESVFEYGLGESTYIADHMGVPRYAGIDSDAAWVAAAREKVSDHFRFYFADIGPTVAWGYPKTTDLAKSILNYQLMPMIVEPRPFDVYMVDGRWRLPCMIVSFLHASARGADHSKTTVLTHDCFVKKLWKSKAREDEGRRRVYRSADHLLDLVDHSGQYLCVYKRKPDTTDAQLFDFWAKNYHVVD